jgi:hypothetical protein
MDFVYLKKKGRNQGTNYPGGVEGGLCGVAFDEFGMVYHKRCRLSNFHPGKLPNRG